MEVQLSTTLFFFLWTTALLVSPNAGYAFPPTTGYPFPPTPTPDDTDYIRTSCETTRYPQICFTSLSGYSGAIRHYPCRLARVAIHVALSNATHMANYVSNISLPRNTSESAAINDCSSVFDDAVDEIRKSHKEMKRLGWTGESVKFQLSNVQTWMSAALTNEDTCTDGFQDLADSGVKADVCNRAVTVKEMTSNALALVNSYADKISV